MALGKNKHKEDSGFAAARDFINSFHSSERLCLRHVTGNHGKRKQTAEFQTWCVSLLNMCIVL